MQVKLAPQENRSGDPSRAAQGFGRVSRQSPPAFDPATDIAAACGFFAQHGYVVLARCLTGAEVEHLNAFCDRTQAERPLSWGLNRVIVRNDRDIRTLSSGRRPVSI